MSDSSSIASLNRRLPWLFIETAARAAGFLSVTAIVAILVLGIELGNSWNLFVASGQVVKARDSYPLLLQSIGSAFSKTSGSELVVLLGGSAAIELTADDPLLSKELTSRCGRDIQFVNLASSSQTLSESWNIAALAPGNRKRLFLVGLNPYRLAFDDRDVISQLSYSPTGIPTAFSLLWSIALHTGHIGSLERVLPAIARQQVLGVKWRLADLLDPHEPATRPASEDPFQPDRSGYQEPVWTRAEKLRQSYEYIASRVLDFHDKYRTGAAWFNRFFDHFEGPASDVKFVLTPTDESFGEADKLVSGDLQDAARLLGGDARVMDLRSQNKNLDSSDFYDTQHLVAKGRAKLQPFFVADVARALGCVPGTTR
jgi:hypothetical protein